MMFRALLAIATLTSGAAVGCSTTHSSGPTQEQGEDSHTSHTPAASQQDGGAKSKCDRYLACATRATPVAANDLEAAYGPSGTCWTTASRETCESTCAEALNLLHRTRTDIAECGDENPYGAFYPVRRHGVRARSKTRRGDILDNFKFSGYGLGGVVAGKRTVSMADFYDPESRTHDVVFVVAAAGWCTTCSAYLEDLASQRASHPRTVVLTVVAEGKVFGDKATLGDFEQFITDNHREEYATVLDPGLAQLGRFANPGVLPLTVVVDARTMEILSANIGAVRADDTMDQWEAWVHQNPPTPN